MYIICTCIYSLFILIYPPVVSLYECIRSYTTDLIQLMLATEGWASLHIDPYTPTVPGHHSEVESASPSRSRAEEESVDGTTADRRNSHARSPTRHSTMPASRPSDPSLSSLRRDASFASLTNNHDTGSASGSITHTLATPQRLTITRADDDQSISSRATSTLKPPLITPSVQRPASPRTPPPSSRDLTGTSGGGPQSLFRSALKQGGRLFQTPQSHLGRHSLDSATKVSHSDTATSTSDGRAGVSAVKSFQRKLQANMGKLAMSLDPLAIGSSTPSIRRSSTQDMYHDNDTDVHTSDRADDKSIYTTTAQARPSLGSSQLHRQSSSSSSNLINTRRPGPPLARYSTIDIMASLERSLSVWGSGADHQEESLDTLDEACGQLSALPSSDHSVGRLLRLPVPDFTVNIDPQLPSSQCLTAAQLTILSKHVALRLAPTVTPTEGVAAVTDPAKGLFYDPFEAARTRLQDKSASDSFALWCIGCTCTLTVTTSNPLCTPLYYTNLQPVFTEAVLGIDYLCLEQPVTLPAYSSHYTITLYIQPLRSGLLILEGLRFTLHNVSYTVPVDSKGAYR